MTERSHSWGEEDNGIISDRIWDEQLRKYVDNTSLVAPSLIEDIKTLSRIIQSDANEDVFRTMFGDHVWVRAHKDGFDIEDHDHD